MFRISYWILPVLSGAVWLGMLMGMLIGWTVDTHREHYSSMDPDQSVAYISDVGASPKFKPLFIACSVLTTVLLDLGFLADRWLRHRGRLVPNSSIAQKTLAVLGILFAIAGAAGLILLSIFDVAHHKRKHDGFLLLFLGGYVLSAVCVCWEYQRLGHHNRNLRILHASFWIKLAFILIEVVLAIIFVCLNFTHHSSPAAVFEWIVAFVFTFYAVSFAIDLYPAVRTASHDHHHLHPFKHRRRSNQGTDATGYSGPDSTDPVAMEEAHGPGLGGDGLVTGGDGFGDPGYAGQQPQPVYQPGRSYGHVPE